MSKGKNPELNPHAVRHPSGRFAPAPATGKGHKEQTSAEHAAGIPNPAGPPKLHPSNGPINGPRSK
jgi:hypothetical protein